MTSFLKAKYLSFILFLVSLTIGFFILDDFGVAWDEPQQRLIGEMNYNRIFHADTELQSFKDRYYGPVLEVPLIMLEKIFDLRDSRQIYLMRHLISHIIFIIGALFFFFLIDLLYQNKLLATIGFLLLVVNPRIYAHSFFNTKDIPFLAVFIICFYLAVLSFRGYKYKHFILLGLFGAFLTNLRIMGVLLIASVCFFLLVDVLISINKENNTRKIGIAFFVFMAAFFATLYLTWPFLWPHPFRNFVLAFTHMSSFPWDSPVLFMGRSINASGLPWYYAPVWFGISNPPVYIVFGLAGIVSLFVKFRLHSFRILKDSKERNNLLYLFCFFVPLIMIFMLDSVVYDGWRQLFFIYPAFILIGFFGLNQIKTNKIRNLVVLILLVSIISSAFGMVKIHPFQNVYFNRLTKRGTEDYLRKNYELDYWAVSLKHALEDILEDDARKKVNIAYPAVIRVYSDMILPVEQRKRINFTDLKDAGYFITNYRWHPDEYYLIGYDKIYSGRVYESEVYSVFRRKQ